MTGHAGIFLARHGETDHNRQGRFQGHLPVGLNRQGRRQAAALAQAARAHGVRALWSSPLARARETAEIVGDALGLEARIDERLAEADAGAWTGRLFSEVAAEEPERFAALFGGNPAFGFPDGESFAEQAVRIVSVLGDIAARPERPVLVIGHAIGIRIVLRRLGLISDPAALRIGNANLVALDPEAWRELTAHGAHGYKP